MNAVFSLIQLSSARLAEFAGLVFSVPGSLSVLQAIHKMDQPKLYASNPPIAQLPSPSRQPDSPQCPLETIFRFLQSRFQFCMKEKRVHAAGSLARALSSFTTPNGLWTYTLVPWED